MKISLVYEIEVADNVLAVEVARQLQNNKNKFSTNIMVGDKHFFATVSAVSIYEKRKHNHWSVAGIPQPRKGENKCLTTLE